MSETITLFAFKNGRLDQIPLSDVQVAAATAQTTALSVDLMTAGALPANTYANGASGVGATLTGNADGALSVDGVVVTAGMKVGVKDEADKRHNGLYAVTTAGDGSHPYALTRATQMDQGGEFTYAVLSATGGDANHGTVFLCTTVSPTVGVSDIGFVALGGVVLAGSQRVLVVNNVIDLAQPQASWPSPARNITAQPPPMDSVKFGPAEIMEHLAYIYRIFDAYKQTLPPT